MYIRAALVLLVVVAIAVTAMLLMRRRAPDGGFFADSDRAAELARQDRIHGATGILPVPLWIGHFGVPT